MSTQWVCRQGLDLSRANLVGYDFMEINFNQVDLLASTLQGSNLSGADMQGSNLFGTKLTAANLSDADLTNAVVGLTEFVRVDLSTVKGLDCVHHSSPSVVDIDTIYRSRGRIPEAFLRGAGVPEDFIVYMRSLVGKPFEFYSCFISYSTKDQEFVDRLWADLQSQEVRCWFAPHDAKGGEKLHEQIDQAIRVHDKVLLVLSPDSMNSEWVKTEISKARKREVQERRKVLFPVRLCSFEALKNWECFDADTGKDSAREIREYFISDFSNWKNQDSYQKAFDRLLRDLKTGKIEGETA